MSSQMEIEFRKKRWQVFVCLRQVKNARIAVSLMQKERGLFVQVSKQCKDLMQRILVADPHKRLTIQQIQQHPW